MEDPKRRGRGPFSEVRCITKSCARFSLPPPFILVESCDVSLNEVPQKGRGGGERRFKAKLTISLGSDNCVLSMAFQDFGEPSIAEQVKAIDIVSAFIWRFVLDTNMKK